MNSPAPEELIARARDGDVEALGELLELYRDPMRMQAKFQLNRKLARRVDASDIVQITFMEAQCGFERFRGDGVGEFKCWLDRILLRNVHEAARAHQQTKKRSINMDRPLEGSSPNGIARRNEHPVDQSTPSRGLRREENAERLRHAIEKLPPDYQDAVRLRYFEDLKLSQIAEQLGRTEPATASLLKRAMARLAKHLGNVESNRE